MGPTNQQSSNLATNPWGPQVQPLKRVGVFFFPVSLLAGWTDIILSINSNWKQNREDTKEIAVEYAGIPVDFLHGIRWIFQPQRLLLQAFKWGNFSQQQLNSVQIDQVCDEFWIFSWTLLVEFWTHFGIALFLRFWLVFEVRDLGILLISGWFLYNLRDTHLSFWAFLSLLCTQSFPHRFGRERKANFWGAHFHICVKWIVCILNSKMSAISGILSRQVLPACGGLCFFCPALRARSRQPVKRYKKLIADIFPRNQVCFSRFFIIMGYCWILS